MFFGSCWIPGSYNLTLFYVDEELLRQINEIVVKAGRIFFKSYTPSTIILSQQFSLITDSKGKLIAVKVFKKWQSVASSCFKHFTKLAY